MSDQTFPFDQFRGLLEKLREAQARTDERAKVTHERFNVFTTLLKPEDEVRLHTRFLHCLLDPKGCHDCGGLFLELFFETLAELPGADHEGKAEAFEFPHAHQPWCVDKEQRRDEFGQIDILLEQKQPNYGIAIENKINHHERKDQLADYASYIEKQHGKGNGLVIFLTLEGKVSESHKGVIPYRRISYRKHILAWLQKCLGNTYHIIPINQVILQYRKLVRDLTGITIESEYMKTIVEFVEKNLDIICYRTHLDEAINQATARFWERVADGIQKELCGFGFRVRPDEQKKFAHQSGALIIEQTPKVPFEVYITNTEDVLAVGISGSFDQKAPSEDNKKLFGQMREKLKNRKGVGWFDSGYDIVDSWPTGWAVLIGGVTGENLVKLMKEPDRTVSDVCIGIKDYIACLEQVYAEVKAQEPKL